MVLQPVQVEGPKGHCGGIGGGAEVVGTYDVPAGLAGLCGVVRFAVVKDPPGAETPTLLPVGIYHDLEAGINPSSQ